MMVFKGDIRLSLSFCPHKGNTKASLQHSNSPRTVIQCRCPFLSSPGHIGTSFNQDYHLPTKDISHLVHNLTNPPVHHRGSLHLMTAIGETNGTKITTACLKSLQPTCKTLHEDLPRHHGSLDRLAVRVRPNETRTSTEETNSRASMSSPLSVV